jgi:hypothetical protein
MKNLQPVKKTAKGTKNTHFYLKITHLFILTSWDKWDTSRKNEKFKL